MPEHDLTPVETPVDELEVHPDNPRQGDVGAISQSIERFGLYQPIVVQRSTSRVVAGNHRLLAARALGWTDIAAIWLDLTDTEARAILIADNRLSDLATNDDHVLLALLKDVAERDDLAGTGYDGDDVQALLEKLEGVPEQGSPSEELAGKFAIIIECASEADQLVLIDELLGRGIECRAAVI